MEVQVLSRAQIRFNKPFSILCVAMHIPRVLLIEGSDSVRKVVEILVDESGWKINSVRSFGEAQEILRTEKFDAVLATERIGMGLGTALLAHVKVNHPGTKRWLLSYGATMPIKNPVVEEVFYTDTDGGFMTNLQRALRKLGDP